MSYELIGQGGGMRGMRGLGGGPTTSCSPGRFPTGTLDMPAGLSQDMKAAVLLGQRACTLSTNGSGTLFADHPAARDLCNASGDPLTCFYAKALGKSFLGRGTVADVNAWQAWVPKAPVSHDAGAPLTPGQAPAASSDTMLYVGLGVAAVAILGAAYYFTKS